MHDLPTSLLKARHAILSGVPGDVSIEILMRPFLQDQEIVDTAIRLDGVDLPGNMLGELADRRFEFPTNPDEGYIDGSIYLGHVHHPVDVTSLHFSRARTGHLTLIVTGRYVFDSASDDAPDTVAFTLATPVSSCAVERATSP